MPSTAFTAMYDDVLPHAPGCIAAVALDAIRKAAIEFCDKSWIWHYNAAAISVVANTSTYSFATPADTEVVTILDGWLNNLPLTHKGSDELKRVNTRWQQWTGSRPIFTTMEDSLTVRLVPSPTVSYASGLNMLLALRPTIAATGIETWIYQKYREQIADGALYRLYMSPKKGYTDMKLAMAKKEMFRKHVGLAYNKSMAGLGRGGSIRFVTA